jgi:surfeit locus 1 family protein
VELKGRFLAEHAIYLENRTSQNNPIHNINNSIGYHVIMPFLLSSGEIVWVNRGWIGKDPISRENIPEILTPTGEVNIGGYISFGEKSIFNKPSIAPHYIHGHSIALTFFLEDAKKDLPNRKTYPFLITQTGKATDGLIRPEVNFFYFSENSLDIRTWWFIQLVTLIFWLISGIVHIKNNPTNNNSNSTAD